MSAIDAAATTLRRDLALVLPAIKPLDELEVALPRHNVPQTVARIASLITVSTAPAITGLHRLSIEACVEAVKLARFTRAKILFDTSRSTPESPCFRRDDRFPVTQTATLGHIYSSDLILWVGCDGASSRITEEIASRQLLAAFLQPDLATVITLRAALAANPTADPIGDKKRIGIVLAHDTDLSVVSQWHKLAASIQQHVRAAVIMLPHPEHTLNHRGAIETVTTMTSLSCTQGGIDFAYDPPRPCDDLASHQRLQGIDLLIDFGVPEPRISELNYRRIAIRPEKPLRYEPIDAYFPAVSIALGSMARIMRFDSIILNMSLPQAAAPGLRQPSPGCGIAHAVRLIRTQLGDKA